MADLQLVLGGPWTPPAPLAPKAPEDQLIESMLEAGLTPPDHVILDGRMHRFSNGKKDKTAWYIAFSDNVPSGRFSLIDWKMRSSRNQRFYGPIYAASLIDWKMRSSRNAPSRCTVLPLKFNRLENAL